MGAKGMATAAGTAVLLYLVLSGRLCGDAAGDGGALEDQLISSALEARRRRKEDTRARREQRRAPPPCTKRRWPERPPDGWGEAAALTARTVGFTWAETLGKWTLGEVAFGIKYYMRQQVCVPDCRCPPPDPPRSSAALLPLGVAPALRSSPHCAVTCLFCPWLCLAHDFF
jgi:hypothetical protein